MRHNGADHMWVRQGSGSWSSGKATTSSNLLQSRRLSSSDPWMPRDDMTVRGVGALHYPSSGHLAGKNDVDFPSSDSLRGSEDPQQFLSPYPAFPTGKSGPVKRSVSPSDRSTVYSGSMSDLQNGNLPLPPIPTSKPEDFFYQQQKDFLKLLNQSNATEKWTYFNQVDKHDQNFNNSGQSKSDDKPQKSEMSSHSQPSSPSLQRRKYSGDTSQYGHNLSNSNNNNVQDKMALSPNQTPKKSPNRTPTKLPKSIPGYSSQKSPNTSNNNINNNNSLQNNHNTTTSTTTNKVSATKSQPLYPESLPPFERPKEALVKTISQMDSSDWEASMQGLQGLVRLTRHHSKLLASPGSLHSLCAPLSKLVRCLRSQVARAACQAASELFTLLGKMLEPELEELAKVLLSRTADTNKFLRADSYQALVAMVTCIPPLRTIPVILAKGAKHQNAVVRSSSCQLLLHIVHLYSPERVLSLPHDLRNSSLIAAAKFLLEGSLETRTAAKELFIQLSKDPKCYSIIREAVPHQLLTSCNKTLVTIFRK